MTWGVKDLECHSVNPEFSFSQQKGRLEIHDSHRRTVLRSQGPDKIEFDLMHGDQGGHPRKKADRLHVIGVTVGSPQGQGHQA